MLNNGCTEVSLSLAFSPSLFLSLCMLLIIKATRVWHKWPYTYVAVAAYPGDLFQLSERPVGIFQRG